MNHRGIGDGSCALRVGLGACFGKGRLDFLELIDAAVHHGGAGTTGASLRAGIVTVIKPYFGDQYFWANRVEDLGVGIGIRKLNVHNFTKALKDATSTEKMAVKAKALGEKIRNVALFP